MNNASNFTSALRNIMTQPLLGLTLALLLNVPVLCAAELEFGIYTSDKATAMVSQFRPVISALERNLSDSMGEPVTIRIQVANSYEDGVDRLVTGEVDFARLGPASYVMAKDVEPGLRIVAMELQNGKKYFDGVICARAGGGIDTVAQLHGKRFAFGNKRSTIGRYLSQRYLLDHDIRAADLSAYDYLSRHDLVGSAVAAGRYDAGALKESTYNKLVAKGEPLTSIATFKNVTKPWVAGADIDTALFEHLQRALLELSDPEALKALKKDGFSRGEDGDYDAIRKAIVSNPEFFEPYKPVTDPGYR